MNLFDEVAKHIEEKQIVKPRNFLGKNLDDFPRKYWKILGTNWKTLCVLLKFPFSLLNNSSKQHVIAIANRNNGFFFHKISN